MANKTITWNDIKAIANSLPEELLTQNVRWWNDQEGGVIYNIDVLEEDYYYDDYIYTPRSVFSDEEFEEQIEDKTNMLPKGTPVLSTYNNKP